MSLTQPQALPLNADTTALWEQLFTNFTSFEDLRQVKAVKGGSGPDFRHATSKEGLW